MFNFYVNVVFNYIDFDCYYLPCSIDYNFSSHILGKPASDLFKLDIKNRTPEENIRDIIQGLYVRKSTQNDTSPSYKTVPTEYRSGFRGMHRSSTDSRKLAYLNALVTLLCKEERSNLGFTPDELMAW